MKKTLLQLISVMLFSNFTYAQKGNIIFIMSSADTLELNNGQLKRQTGIFLNEFYLAYKALSKAGYTVEFASPNGHEISIDNESLKNQYWKSDTSLKHEALTFIAQNQRFLHPKSLKDVLREHDYYSGLIIPGGQGVMVDLMYDENIPLLLKIFAQEEKAIGLICHAPSLITTIPASENPFTGFTVNSVSPIEEFYIERIIMKGKPKNRKIAKQLKALGLNYKQRKPKANFAVRDRFLVSSQNPFSGEAFNQLYLEALEDFAKN